MMSTCAEHGVLEVVDEDPFQVIPGVDDVLLEAFEPHQRCRFQHHRGVEDFGGVGAFADLNGGGVDA